MIFIDLIDGQSEQARQEIRRLLRRAPNEPSVHSTAAYLYRLSGQYDLALEQWDRLLKISPTDIAYAAYNRARLYMYQGDYAKAGAELAKGMAFEPNHPSLKAYRALLNFYRGEIDKAMSEVGEVLAGHPDLHSHKITLAYCHLAKGETGEALELLDDHVMAAAQADQDSSYRLATAYAMAGMADEAIEWLERAVAMGNENYPWISTNRYWGAVQEDPRFKAILERLKAKWESRVESN
jgi:serine/threonine-protein kinase